MAYEQRPNTGSLFKNDRKEADTHADYRGSALLEGTEYWLDAWINESSTGAKYMSLKFKPKIPNTGGVTFTNTTPAPVDLDDDVPF